MMYLILATCSVVFLVAGFVSGLHFLNSDKDVVWSEEMTMSFMLAFAASSVAVFLYDT